MHLPLAEHLLETIASVPSILAELECLVLLHVCDDLLKLLAVSLMWSYGGQAAILLEKRRATHVWSE